MCMHHYNGTFFLEKICFRFCHLSDRRGIHLQWGNTRQRHNSSWEFPALSADRLLFRFTQATGHFLRPTDAQVWCSLGPSQHNSLCWRLTPERKQVDAPAAFTRASAFTKARVRRIARLFSGRNSHLCSFVSTSKKGESSGNSRITGRQKDEGQRGEVLAPVQESQNVGP